jgi:phosphate-selective porin OprO/OprP
MNLRSLASVLAALATTTFAVAADNPASPLEDRLARLEAQLARLEARLGEAVTADELAPTLKEFADVQRSLGYDGKTPLSVVKVAGAETKLALGGFVHANFESGTAPDSRWAGISDRFLLRRARLFVTGTFAEAMSFKLESDFGNNSISAKTGLSGQLTDAFLAWTKYSAANVKVGQFKTPFGYEQIMSDTKLPTIERSLTNDRLTQGRQIGGQVGGDLFNKKISYAVAAFNGTGTNIGSNDSQKFMWVGRTSAVAYDGKLGHQKAKITAGANYFTTVDKGTFAGRRYGTGVDAQVLVGPAELTAEVLRNDLHPVTGKPTASNGWALLGALSLTKQWQALARYESFDSNTATAATTTNEWTFGVNYFLRGDDLKLSLNYISGRQPAPAPQGDRVIGRLQVMF